MIRFIFRRSIEMMVALLIMSVIVFVLARLTGDPTALLLSEYASQQEKQELEERLGLDKPVIEQYGIFIVNALQGDLGNSIIGDRRPAMELVLERLPASLELAASAFVFSLCIGVPLGVHAAVRRGRKPDFAIRFITLFGQSVPVFWLGIVLIYLFAVKLGWFPVSGGGGPMHLVLPTVSMGFFTVAAVTRLVRVSMIDALNTEYVKLARIKGLSETRVIWKHALRNSLIPVLTFMGAFFATMITGAVVVETVFSWPGIGRLAYQAILNRDFPVMQAVVLTTTAIFMLANLLVDIAYAWIDPRVEQ